ncbi:MAG TPA: hypothetical protein VFH91_00680 [Pyrinomonadaceae bacterium]|nr:hypothetical protein [Pyrinomonadaceae bacterium]
MRPIPQKILFLFICLAIFGLGSLTIQAQSGRRQNKTPELAPVPTPTPEPTPQAKSKPKDSDLGFFLGVDRSTTYMNFYGADYDAIIRGCGDKLRDGSSGFVDVASQDLNRSDAIKKAKAEKTTYVVLLSLQTSTMSSNSNNDIEVEYVVFAPVTGKIVTSGRTYPGSRRAGPVIGPSSTSGLYRDQLLRMAGEDAGERILKSLHLSSGTVIPN